MKLKDLLMFCTSSIRVVYICDGDIDELFVGSCIDSVPDNLLQADVEAFYSCHFDVVTFCLRDYVEVANASNT